MTLPNVSPLLRVLKKIELNVSRAALFIHVFVASDDTETGNTGGIHKFLWYTNDNRISVSLPYFPLLFVVIIITIIMTRMISFTSSNINIFWLTFYQISTDYCFFCLFILFLVNFMLPHRLQQQMPMLIDPVILCIF